MARSIPEPEYLSRQVLRMGWALRIESNLVEVQRFFRSEYQVEMLQRFRPEATKQHSTRGVWQVAHICTDYRPAT